MENHKFLFLLVIRNKARTEDELNPDLCVDTSVSEGSKYDKMKETQRKSDISSIKINCFKLNEWQ